MKTLHLTLKKKWFDMILSGEKKEEYREVKYYWIDMSKYQVVEIEWQDAQRPCDDWTSIEDIAVMEMTICTTVGYLLAEDDVMIIVVSTLDSLEEGAYGIGGMKIPKCAVVNRRELK